VAKVWRGEYWKAKKGSPWFVTVVVLGVLWAYGHVNGSKDSSDHSSSRPGPSASASASPGKH
jgi:hypothetical protein